MSTGANRSAPSDKALSDEVMAKAAAWSMRLAQPDADRKSFQAWLDADPRHHAAFEKTQGAWDMFDAPEAEQAVAAARQGVLARAYEARQRRSEMRMRGGIAAIAAATVLALLSWPLIDGVDVYRTGLGERRFVTLNDGSRLALDALTQVEVRYTPDARKLKLIKGQARFDVAHDAARPFAVTARDRTVIATGTAFNIDILEPKLLVTLIEGRVEIVPVKAEPQQVIAAKPIVLGSGQQLIARVGHDPVVSRVNLEETTAWQVGKLIFEDETLVQAVERVNRYTEHKIVVADATAAALKISGVFHTGDEADFIEAVTTYLPVSARDSGAGVIVLNARP